MTVRIVAANAASVPDMLGVMDDAFDPRFGEAWSGAQLIGTMIQAGSWTRLAMDDDLAIGFTLCRHILDEAELLLVGVRRDRRGQGVGRMLMSAAAETAATLGARSMFLEMRDGNASASRLYLNQGFAEVGRRRDYYRGGAGERFDAITFRRSLNLF
jgi:ribosomal-protein-alanine N-acetyltransferase